MSALQTMVQSDITFDAATFLLAQNQDIQDLKHRIESAVHEGGRFVEFTVVGNRAVSVLVGPTTRVTVSLETVEYDPRDTGDEEDPYDGLLDY
ncbi:hypothetical protein QWJ90_06815 [Microbacterium oryzae]|uniref:hypothetical protein n=1 Tax=Microbacterium oryzae TaxID=743009 RepID=UPI0025B137E3|nr:hypothetical protein [Microbacterium oryzae]MDN3310637.1 hypothetical protein [Microbacterium oryzae]